MNPIHLDGAELQLLIRCLADGSLLSPGFEEVCRALAEKFVPGAPHLFEEFRRLRADLVKPMTTLLPPAPPEALDGGRVRARLIHGPGAIGIRAERVNATLDVCEVASMELTPTERALVGAGMIEAGVRAEGGTLADALEVMAELWTTVEPFQRHVDGCQLCQKAPDNPCAVALELMRRFGLSTTDTNQKGP